MVIEIALIALLSFSLLTLAYALRQINNVATNAFSFIKSTNLEEKIQGDSLERTLKKVEKIAPPYIKKPPNDPKSDEFAEQTIKQGTLKDGQGNIWEVI